MSNITFNSLNIELPEIDHVKVTDWVEKVALSHDFVAGNINYIFTDDATILDVNRQFLNHDYYTDIITFDYSKRRTVNGDLYISLDTVASNANQLQVPYNQELYRVIIHGVLHLCGINDKGPGEREIMEQHENAALSLLPEI